MTVIPDLMTVAEAMAALRCSQTFVYDLVNRGVLRGHRVSPRKILIETASVRAFLDRTAMF